MWIERQTFKTNAKHSPKTDSEYLAYPKKTVDTERGSKRTERSMNLESSRRQQKQALHTSTQNDNFTKETHYEPA